MKLRMLSRSCRYVNSRKSRSEESLLGVNELHWMQWWSHRGAVIFYYLLGTIFLCAPADWFGLSWSYFKFIPHGGIGIGVTCLILGTCLIMSIWLRSKMLISLVLLLGAVSFWVAAFLIAAQGLAAHTGLMEAPFMMYISVDMMLRSAVARR